MSEVGHQTGLSGGLLNETALFQRVKRKPQNEWGKQKVFHRVSEHVWLTLLGNGPNFHNYRVVDIVGSQNQMKDQVCLFYQKLLLAQQVAWTLRGS